jgi:hypothetical protein
MSLRQITPENQPHMLPRDMQLANEYRFARDHIDGYVRNFLRDDEDIQPRLLQGVEMLHEYFDQTYYDSKNKRIDQVRHMDLNALVFEIFVASAYCQSPELFTSFTAKLAGILKFDDKQDSITTLAEMVAVLTHTDVFDIVKPHKMASLQIQSNIELSDQLHNYVINCSYLPPLVYKPMKLTKNRQTPYLTITADSVILGKANHHEEDVCLDVLNICNSVELRLDTQFLCTVEEEPSKEFTSVEQLRDWDNMKRQSYEHYRLMTAQGNKFYLSHKYDKRLRLYCQGYHISTQGSPFKKAAVELYKQELVTGLPDHLRL